jgi:hypothetical protein
MVEKEAPEPPTLKPTADKAMLDDAATFCSCTIEGNASEVGWKVIFGRNETKLGSEK